MGLRSKILLIVLLTFVALIAGVRLVLSSILLAEFQTLESESVTKDVARAQKALLAEIKQLSLKAADWSNWDDTYQFITDLNEDYIKSNLHAVTLSNLAIDDINLFDANGDFRYGIQYGVSGKQFSPGLRAELLEALRAKEYLHHIRSAEEIPHDGLLVLKSGILLITARPILPSSGEGEVRGTIVFSKLLDAELLNKVALQAELSLQLIRLDERTSDPSGLSLPKLSKSHPIEQAIVDEDTRVGFGAVLDFDSNIPLLLRVQEHRDIFEQGKATLDLLFLALLVAGALVTCVIALLLETTVVKRLLSLSEQVRTIASSGDSSQSVELQGADELATVSTSINQMLSALNSTEQQLRVAKELAEAATKTRTQFVANMSHEIRTPINGILGMSQVLEKMPLGSDERQYVEMIKSSSVALLGVVNEVLDFSKIDEGKLLLEEIRFDLFQVINDALRSLALRAQEKGLELLCSVASDVPVEVEGDPVRLRQVVLNLLGNAIKFTERGEIELKVFIEERGEEDSRFHFVIRDTGIGVAEEKLDSIFEAFAQADGSTARKYGGTGLGLTISRQIVELMKGKIWVTSKLGVGTEFHFTCMLGNESSNFKCARFAPGETVVLVDDNKCFGDAVREAVGRAGGVAIVREAMPALKELQMSSKVLLDAELLSEAELPEVLRAFPEDQFKLFLLVPMIRSDYIQAIRKVSKHPVIFKPVLLEMLLQIMTGSRVEETLPADNASPSSEISSLGKPLRILVADDVLVNQEVLRLMLEPQGHQVTLVQDGREVLRSLAETGYFRTDDGTADAAFDVVLMDSQMPEVDGTEATRRIRAWEKLYNEKTGQALHVPIIAVTANALQGERDRLLKLGVDEYLAKPIFADDLYEKLRLVCYSGERKQSCDVSQNVQAEVLQSFDIQELERRFGGSEAIVSQMLDIYEEEGPELVQNLRAAIASGDSESIRRAAHALRGSLANISAKIAWEIATELEEKPNLTAVANLFQRLEESLQTLTFEIGRYKDSRERFGEAPRMS